MKRVLIFILIFLCVLTGCKSTNTMNAKDNNFKNNKVEITILPEIEVYSPMMSSVPGIPLNAKLNADTSGKSFKFHWITEQGTFLSWHPVDGKIITLGKDITVNDEKVYWSINPNEKLSSPAFTIYLKIESTDSSELISETSIQVEQNKEGFFTIKK